MTNHRGFEKKKKVDSIPNCTGRLQNKQNKKKTLIHTFMIYSIPSVLNACKKNIDYRGTVCNLFLRSKKKPYFVRI